MPDGNFDIDPGRYSDHLNCSGNFWCQGDEDYAALGRVPATFEIVNAGGTNSRLLAVRRAVHLRLRSTGLPCDTGKPSAQLSSAEPRRILQNAQW